MDLKPLPFRSSLEQYQKQSEELLEATPDADAQLAIARWYNFRSWAELAEYVAALTWDDSPVVQFESAVEAVITSDRAVLESLLRNRPEFIRARSTRVHRTTLLHYVAANGVALANIYGGRCTTMSMLVSKRWSDAARRR
jgi:hypothetical protein